jgi:cytoskeletal protein CcmA (bactofilin family)
MRAMTLFSGRSSSSSAIGFSVIDQQMVVRGEINTQGGVRVDGRLEGREQKADTLIVGSTGVVTGDVEAREVIVAGTIEGNIIADGRVEIKATACVRGDIRTTAMLLHEGGVIDGHVTVDRHAMMTPETPRLELTVSRATTNAMPG